MAEGKNTSRRVVMVEGNFNTREHAEFWLFQKMQELPAALQPETYSEGERPKKKDRYPIADRQAFEHFIKTHGGFLHGKRFRILAYLFNSTHRHIPSEITFWAPASNARLVNTAADVLASFGSSQAVYGFGCDFEEYECRNQLCIKLSDSETGTLGASFAFYGKDHRRYVPGFYWLNYFSNPYIEQMQLDIPALADALEAEKTVTPDGVVLKLYDHPSDWPEHRERVGQVIREWENVFCIEDMNAPERMAFNEKDLWSQEAHKKWP
jgi:hypothetical protein